MSNERPRIRTSPNPVLRKRTLQGCRQLDTRLRQSYDDSQRSIRATETVGHVNRHTGAAVRLRTIVAGTDVVGTWLDVTRIVLGQDCPACKNLYGEPMFQYLYASIIGIGRPCPEAANCVST